MDNSNSPILMVSATSLQDGQQNSQLNDRFFNQQNVQSSAYQLPNQYETQVNVIHHQQIRQQQQQHVPSNSVYSVNLSETDLGGSNLHRWCLTTKPDGYYFNESEYSSGYFGESKRNTDHLQVQNPISYTNNEDATKTIDYHSNHNHYSYVNHQYGHNRNSAWSHPNNETVNHQYNTYGYYNNQHLHRQQIQQENVQDRLTYQQHPQHSSSSGHYDARYLSYPPSDHYQSITKPQQPDFRSSVEIGSCYYSKSTVTDAKPWIQTVSSISQPVSNESCHSLVDQALIKGEDPLTSQTSDFAISQQDQSHQQQQQQLRQDCQSQSQHHRSKINLMPSKRPESKATSLGEVNSNSGQRVNQCCVCKRNYARPSTLKTHLRTHTNERPYKCSVCLKTFSQAANLTAHQRVHTGERPFSCPICGRKFSQSSSVITHLRTHSGERPYRCSLCSRTFSDSSTLTKHCRIHSGEKPYQCDQCPLNFSQSGNLSRHLKLHLLNSNSESGNGNGSSSIRSSKRSLNSSNGSSSNSDDGYSERASIYDGLSKTQIAEAGEII